MTDKNPAISVIILVYNTEQYIRECLDSVLNQTFNDIEIICIDDCSIDNSLKILEDYAKRDSRLKIFSHQKNLGCVATKNEGIRIAKGEFIYPFDSDDIIHPMTLEKLYNAMCENLGDIISCDAELFGNKNEKFSLPAPTVYNLACQNCIINSSLFRKSDFLQLQNGGYDPYFKNGLEDYDLWLNFVFKYNKRIYRIPETLYFYRIKSEKESRNASFKMQRAEYIQYMELKYPEICLYKLIDYYHSRLLSYYYSLQHKVIYIKLFMFLPFLKIRVKKHSTYIYLFYYIPILKFKNK